MTAREVAMAGGSGTTSAIQSAITSILLLRIAEYAFRAVGMLILRVSIKKIVDSFSKPEVILNQITPEEYRNVLAWDKGGAGRLKNAVDFIKFLRDFNMRFADLTTFAGIFGTDSAQIASAVANAYQWSYGLGWLSWIGTGQILQKVVSEPIGQELDYLIRNKLLTESAAIDLWKKNLINDDELKDYLFRLGYDEKKVEMIMKKEIVEMASGMYAKLIQLGFISKDEFKRRCKLFGLSDEQTEILYLSAFKEPSISILYKAFKSGVISESIIKNYLKAMGYDDLSISLILASSKEERIEEDKKLSKSEILSFFRAGILREDEARGLLKLLGYDDNEINLLIEFEKLKLAKGKKEIDKTLSKSEILRAYKEQVINRIEAEELLARLGYDANEISVLLQIAEQSRTKDKSERKKDLARSDILRAFRLGIITKEQAKNMIVQLGFSHEDAEFILNSAEVKEEEKRLLTTSQIMSAASRRIMTISQAYDYLKSLGYGDFEIEVIFKLNYTDKEVLAVIERMKRKEITIEEFARLLENIGLTSADISIIRSIYDI